MLGQLTSLTHLELCHNDIEQEGVESLPGVLIQCTALDHLNLGQNVIGAAGTESFVGVFGQCITGTPRSQIQLHRICWGREASSGVVWSSLWTSFIDTLH